MRDIWGIVLVAAVTVAGIAGAAVYFRRRSQRRIARILLEQWGAKPERAASEDELLGIRVNAAALMDFDVDDITWNDLEMDRVYREANNAQTTAGDHMLYALLRRPCLTEGDLLRRQAILDWAAQDEAGRERIKRRLYRLGRVRNIDIRQMLEKQWYDARMLPLCIGLSAALAVSIALGAAGLRAAWAVAGILAFGNSLLALRSRKKIGVYMAVVGYIPRLIGAAGRIIGESTPALDALRARLIPLYERVRGIAGSWIAASYTGVIVWEDFTSFLRLAFLIDAISYHRLTRAVWAHREELRGIYMLVGELDALIAAASWRQALPQWCRPEMDGSGIAFEGMVHPLLPGAVPNSADLQGNLLLTGSNASGKSTFLKAVALNALLAQALGTATAQRWRGGFFRVYTSMALRDNLFQGESYFIAEIRSLKRLLDAREGQPPCLCIIDEVLRGTNTGERIAAAAQVLTEMGQGPGLCLAATHDGELTGLLGPAYRNCHFTETIVDGDVRFDYRLRQGPAASRNAIALLGIMGFDQQLVEHARERLQRFEQTGVWS